MIVVIDHYRHLRTPVVLPRSVAAPLAISVTVSGLSRLFAGDLRTLVEAAHVADAVGIDQLMIPDHLAMSRNTAAYPYGRFPLPLEEPWLEPLTTLAAIASVTKRIRLATGVLIAPIRAPLVLAKTAATVDVLSGGRLDLGVGTGWQAEEYAAVGVPWEERWRRLEDGLRACRALWRDAPASFRSASVSFDELWCLPRPVQPGGVPLWFGVGLGPKNLARIVELGAGWMPMDSRPESIRAGLAQIRAAFEAAGRDFAGFGARAHAPFVLGADKRPDLDASLAGLPALAEAGATAASFALGAFCSAPADVRPFLERLAKSAGR
jgi:probable F420-dependent oxidoreductase